VGGPLIPSIMLTRAWALAIAQPPAALFFLIPLLALLRRHIVISERACVGFGHLDELARAATELAPETAQ
jgi:hypothetical protein